MKWTLAALTLFAAGCSMNMTRDGLVDTGASRPVKSDKTVVAFAECIVKKTEARGDTVARVYDGPTRGSLEIFVRVVAYDINAVVVVRAEPDGSGSRGTAYYRRVTNDGWYDQIVAGC